MIDNYIMLLNSINLSVDNLEDTMTMEIPREEDYSERDYEDDNSDYDYNNRHVESHNRAERFRQNRTHEVHCRSLRAYGR